MNVYYVSNSRHHGFFRIFCCARREMSHPGDPDWEAASVRGPWARRLTYLWTSLKHEQCEVHQQTWWFIKRFQQDFFGISHSEWEFHHENPWNIVVIHGTSWNFEWGNGDLDASGTHLGWSSSWTCETLAMAMALFKNNFSMNTSYPWYQLSIICNI